LESVVVGIPGQAKSRCIARGFTSIAEASKVDGVCERRRARATSARQTDEYGGGGGGGDKLVHDGG
jgi:hypothetical protein